MSADKTKASTKSSSTTTMIPTTTLKPGATIVVSQTLDQVGGGYVSESLLVQKTA